MLHIKEKTVIKHKNNLICETLQTMPYTSLSLLNVNEYYFPVKNVEFHLENELTIYHRYSSVQ